MKKKKILQGLLLGAIGFATLGFGVACGDKNPEEPAFTGFLEGVAVKVPKTELIYWEHFVDYVTDSEYKITLSNKDWETPLDITEMARWEPTQSGEYTITYEIFDGEHEGTYTHTFLVAYNTLLWVYTNTPIDIQYDKEISFELLETKLNVSVTTHKASDWDFFVESIRVDDQIIEIDKDATSYYVDSMEPHYITYGVRTVDGQWNKSIITANVYYSLTEAQLYLHSGATGEYTFAVDGATSVQINGEDVPQEDVTITPTEIRFDKQTLYKKYKGTNLVSIQTPLGEVRDTINVYTEQVSFEEEGLRMPGFISFHQKDEAFVDGRMRITNKFATDGQYALEGVLSAAYYWPMMSIKLEYLDMIFADDSVTSFAFDMTYAGTYEYHTHKSFNFKTPSGEKLMANKMLYRNVPTTIALSREQYQILKEEGGNLWIRMTNTRDSAGGWDKPPTVYLDNFRAVVELGRDSLPVISTDVTPYRVDLAGVTKVTLNGQSIPEGKITVDANGFTIDKAWLLSNMGENILSIMAKGKVHEKVVNVYRLETNFEDGIQPSFITWYKNVIGTMNIVEYNGSKALKMADDNAGAGFLITNDYLSTVFADASVESISFQMWLEWSSDVADSIYFNSSFQAKFMTFDEANAGPYTLTITKAQYLTLGESDARFYFSNSASRTGQVLLTWYIDNWSLVKNGGAA